MVEILKEDAGKKDASKNAADVISLKLEEQFNNISRRLRIMEERYSSLREQIRFTDQSLLKIRQKFSSDIKSADSELADLSGKITLMQDKMKELLKELTMCGKQEDLKVIEKYLEIWEPVQFATKKQVLDAIAESRRKV
jgi:uncharacterized protein involved in exopolysaccharide biosynthesis